MYLVSIYVTQIKHARFFLLLVKDDRRIVPQKTPPVIRKI